MSKDRKKRLQALRALAGKSEGMSISADKSYFDKIKEKKDLRRKDIVDKQDLKKDVIDKIDLDEDLHELTSKGKSEEDLELEAEKRYKEERKKRGLRWAF